MGNCRQAERKWQTRRSGVRRASGSRPSDGDRTEVKRPQRLQQSQWPTWRVGAFSPQTIIFEELLAHRRCHALVDLNHSRGIADDWRTGGAWLECDARSGVRSMIAAITSDVVSQCKGALTASTSRTARSRRPDVGGLSCASARCPDSCSAVPRITPDLVQHRDRRDHRNEAAFAAANRMPSQAKVSPYAALVGDLMCPASNRDGRSAS